MAVADGLRNGEVPFFGDISSDPASVPSMANKLQSAEPNFTFATRPVPRVTVFIARFSNWGMTAWWWHRRWFQACGRLSEDKPPGCLKPGSPAPRGRADRGLGSGGSMRRSATWCGLASCQPYVEAGTSAPSVFLVASWPDLYRPHALDACPYKMANTPGLRSPRHQILLISIWIMPPGTTCSYRRTGSAGSRSFSRDSPARVSTRLTVAGETATTRAMCSPVRRWRRPRPIRSTAAWSVAFGLCLGRDERAPMPARPSAL